MPSHSFPKIDQKEYLKKYLSGDKSKKKKKDKKHKRSSKDAAKVKIIDDDVNHLDNGPQIDEELLLTGEDAPQIVGEYLQEAPADVKVPKWKSIVIKDEPDEKESCNDAHLWGHKTSEMRIKKEYSTDEKYRSNRTPDNSPRRKKERRRKSATLSPSRRLHKSPSRSGSYKRDKSSTKTRDSLDSPSRRPKIKTEPLYSLYENGTKTLQNNSRYSVEASSSSRRNYSDQSPPRKKGNSSPTLNERNFERPPSGRERSTARMKNEQTPDNSPIRRRRNFSPYPSRTKKHVNRSPDDDSPSRRRKYLHQSPARKTYSSSSNNSAPRRRKSYDQSPATTSRARSPDQSPPRRKQNLEKYSQSRNRRGDSDQSPPRRTKHTADVSPARKYKQRIETPNNSPPRKSRKASEPSPARKRRNSDQSPPRRRRQSSQIEVQVKREKRTPELSPRPARHSRWGKQESELSQSPPPTHKPKPVKTLEGKTVGLQNAQALHKETKERRKKEDLLFETMSSDISGRNAEVQVRSTGRKGRRAREAADEDPEERRRKDEYEEKKKQQYDRWGKGLKQLEDHKNRLLQQEYESSKPLARYANDEDLERHLKDQERAEDPMLDYMRQKRREKEKQSGKPEIPRYKGPYPENRFGICPGYRWDGVDRSNGYEKKYFAVQNEKQARQDEAYKYSVEDM